MEIVMLKKRQTEFDILRLIAILAVISMHAGGNSYLEPHFSHAIHSSFVAGIVWCVPVFFLISGRFFLDPERNVTLEKIWIKYVPRVAIAFIVWSAVYSVYYVVSGGWGGLNIAGILNQFIVGPYHFWYLYSLIGLYLLTPFLRKIAADKKLLIYFLVLFAVFDITLEYMSFLPKVGGIIETFAESFGMNMVVGYVGYFMLGYYLHSIRDEMSTRAEITIYIIGIVMLIGTIWLNSILPSELQDKYAIVQYKKPNVILYSSAIYLFFDKRVSKMNFSDQTRTVLGKLTELSFGVYILHALVNEFISYIPLPEQITYPHLVLCILTVIIYAISLGLTWCIRKIPYIGRRIT